MDASRTVRISSKGQLVIPLDMRQQLGLQAGDTLSLHLLSDRLLLIELPLRSPYEEAIAGLRAAAAEQGVTREDVEQAVAEARHEVFREGSGPRPLR